MDNNTSRSSFKSARRKSLASHAAHSSHRSQKAESKSRDRKSNSSHSSQRQGEGDNEEGVYPLEKTVTNTTRGRDANRRESQSSFVGSNKQNGDSPNRIVSNLRSSGKVRLMEIAEFKLRCNQQMQKLEDLGNSYSENEQGQFHLDSLPAVLTELFLTIKLSVQLKQLPRSNSDQDVEILDRIFDYISSHFKSQFINQDRILFSIQDCIALVDRFLKEFETTSMLVDTSDNLSAFKKQKSKDSILKGSQRHSSLGKATQSKNGERRSVSIEDEVAAKSARSRKSNGRSQGRGSIQMEYGEDYKSQGSMSSSNSVSEQTKSFNLKTHGSSIKSARKSQAEIRELVKKGSSVHFHMPSPKYADIQYLREFQEEQEQVITLDEGLLNFRSNSKNRVSQGSLHSKRDSIGGKNAFSLRETLLKTIAEYERILQYGRFKQGEQERAQVQKIIDKLKRQLEEEESGVIGHRRETSQRSSELFDKINEIGSIDLNQERMDNIDSLRLHNLMVIKEETSVLHTPQVLDLIIENKKFSNNISPEEARLQNLQEIFLIYCRQHVMIGKNPTFDQIKKEVRNLNLGEFIKFSKDFEFKLHKDAVMKIFKKLAALIQLYREQNLQEIEKLNKEGKEVRVLLRKQRKLQEATESESDAAQPDQRSQEQTDAEDSKLPQSESEGQPIENQRKEVSSPEIKVLKQRLQKLNEEIKRLQLDNEDEEKIFKYVTEEMLNIDDPAKYRKKIKGFTSAFGDKQERMLDILQPDLLMNNSKLLRGQKHPKEEVGQESKNANGPNGNASALNQQYSDGLFKPFLYKDQYKRKVKSVLRQKISDKAHKISTGHLPDIENRGNGRVGQEQRNQEHNAYANYGGNNNQRVKGLADQSPSSISQYQNYGGRDEQVYSSQSRMTNALYERVKQRELQFRNNSNTSRLRGASNLLNIKLQKGQDRSNLSSSQQANSIQKGYQGYGSQNVDLNFSPDVSMTKSNRGFKYGQNGNASEYPNQSPQNRIDGEATNKNRLQEFNGMRRGSGDSTVNHLIDSKRMQLVNQFMLDSNPSNYNTLKPDDQNSRAQNNMQQRLTSNASAVLQQDPSAGDGVSQSLTFQQLAEQRSFDDQAKRDPGSILLGAINNTLSTEDRQISEQFQTYERQIQQESGEAPQQRQQNGMSKMTTVKIMNTAESSVILTKNRFFKNQSNNRQVREGQKVSPPGKNRLNLESLMNINHHFDSEDFYKNLIEIDTETNDFEVDIAFAQDIAGSNRNNNQQKNMQGFSHANEKLNPPKQILIGERDKSQPRSGQQKQAPGKDTDQQQSKGSLSRVQLNLYKNKLSNIPNLLQRNPSKDQNQISIESPERFKQSKDGLNNLKSSVALKPSLSQMTSVQQNQEKPPLISVEASKQGLYQVPNQIQRQRGKKQNQEMVHNSMEVQKMALANQQLQNQYSSMQQSQNGLPFQIIPMQPGLNYQPQPPHYNIQPFQMTGVQTQQLSMQPPTFAHSRQSIHNTTPQPQPQQLQGSNQFIHNNQHQPSLFNQAHNRAALNASKMSQQQQNNNTLFRDTLQNYNFGGQNYNSQMNNQAVAGGSTLVLPQIGKPQTDLNLEKQYLTVQQSYQQKIPQSQKHISEKQQTVSRRKSSRLTIQQNRGAKPSANQTVGNIIAQQAHRQESTLNNSALIQDPISKQRMNIKAQLNKSSLM